MIVLFLSVAIMHSTVKWPCGADGKKKRYIQGVTGGKDHTSGGCSLC